MTGFLRHLGQYPVSLLVIIVSNIVLILGFTLGKIVLWKWENAVKFFALYSVVMSFMLSVYFISILWFSISNLAAGNAVYAAIFPVFLFLPFIIGHFSSYEKIHFYSNVQILTLIISLLLALSFI